MQPLKINTIDTPRLILREITPKIYDILFQSYDDHDIKETLGLGSDDELQVERDRYLKGMTTHNRSFVLFLLIEKATGKLVGRCGYHTWYLQHNRAEMGYAMTDDTHKGKGLMTEAMAAIIPYGFNTMNLHRIEAFISPWNTPSLKLVQRIGFVKEGSLRQHYFKNGTFEDSDVYGLIKPEYQPVTA